MRGPREHRSPSPRWEERARRVFAPLLACGFWLLATTTSILAAPTQEEVFKSINQSVGEPTDPSKFVALLFGAAGVTGGLATPGCINWLVASARDANLFS